MFSNTKQGSQLEMINYLLKEKNLGNPKAINALDDEHRTAVRRQKSLLYKQYRLPCRLASSRDHAPSNGLCEVLN